MRVLGFRILRFWGWAFWGSVIQGFEILGVRVWGSRCAAWFIFKVRNKAQYPVKKEYSPNHNMKTQPCPSLGFVVWFLKM